jgi:hypothetical protein
MFSKNITPRLRLIGCYLRTPIVVLGISGFLLNFSKGAETLSVLKPIEAERAVKRLPKYASFYYSAPAFFQAMRVSQGEVLKPVAFAGIQSN